MFAYFLCAKSGVMITGSAWCSFKTASFVFSGSGGLVNDECHWLLELGDLGASSSYGSHKNWESSVYNLLIRSTSDSLAPWCLP